MGAMGAGGRPDATEVQAALPPHTLFRPSHDGSNENLLILLHGLGDTPGTWPSHQPWPLHLAGSARALPKATPLSSCRHLHIPIREEGLWSLPPQNDASCNCSLPSSVELSRRGHP